MKLTNSVFISTILLSFFLGSMTLSSCGGNSSDSANEQEIPTANTTASNPASADGTKSESPLGSRPAYVPPKAVQNPLTLGVANQTVKSGSPVCLNVQVSDFNQLLSMQYSVRWDPAMLDFKSVQNFQLGGLGPEDFGAHRAEEGILTSVWIDENLQGVTIPDGATIYQICFQVTGSAGQSTEVSFSDGPTPFEVVNLKEEVVELKGVAGRVRIN